MSVVHLLLFALGDTTAPKIVADLPGYGPPPTKHHSGFVEVDKANGVNLFYVLAESAGDPSKDPVVWWMNGGPGASSLAGMFGENGAVLLAADGKTLFDNPYAWNAHANVLYVEFAPGIGYSYCANSTVGDLPFCSAADRDTGACSPCLASDDSVAQWNVEMAKQLFVSANGGAALFPQFKGRALYIAGESYAGVYIPTLAKAMVEADAGLLLKGIWVTDPCTDNKAQFGWLDLGIDFLYGMGILSTPLYETLNSSVCSPTRTAVGDRVRSIASPACRTAWRQYDLASAGIGDAVHPAGIANLPMYIDPLSALGPSGGPDLPGYVGSAAVRAALNAETSANKNYHMEIGNNGYDQYTLDYAACNPDAATLPAGTGSMLDVHRFLATAPQTHPASAFHFDRIIISSGDVDPVVSLHGTEAAAGACACAARRAAFSIAPRALCVAHTCVLLLHSLFRFPTTSVLNIRSPLTAGRRDRVRDSLGLRAAPVVLQRARDARRDDAREAARVGAEPRRRGGRRAGGGVHKAVRRTRQRGGHRLRLGSQLGPYGAWLRAGARAAHPRAHAHREPRAQPAVSERLERCGGRAVVRREQQRDIRDVDQRCDRGSDAGGGGPRSEGRAAVEATTAVGVDCFVRTRAQRCALSGAPR
jgi:hypothetical protein